MPGNTCSVTVCKNKARLAKSKLIFHSFPKDPVIRKQWIEKSGRNDAFNPDNGRICSDHFVEDDYEDIDRARLLGTKPKQLKKNSIPSRHLVLSDVPQQRTILPAEVKQKFVIRTLFNCPKLPIPRQTEPNKSKGSLAPRKIKAKGQKSEVKTLLVRHKFPIPRVCPIKMKDLEIKSAMLEEKNKELINQDNILQTKNKLLEKELAEAKQKIARLEGELIEKSEINIVAQKITDNEL